MSSIVAPDREVIINGRHYRCGDQLPDIRGIPIERLASDGVIVTKERQEKVVPMSKR